MNPRTLLTSILGGLFVGLFMVGILTMTGCTTKKVGPAGPGNSYEVDTPAPASVTVTGVVNDQDGIPVTGVVVRLDNGKATVTDGEGKYRFDDVEPGLHGVAVYRKGHTAGYTSVVVSGDKADAEPVVVKPFEKVDGYVEQPAQVSEGGIVEEAVQVEAVSDGRDGRPSIAAISLPKGVKIILKDGRLISVVGAVSVSVAPLSIFEVPGLMGGSEVVGGRIEKDFPVSSAEFGPSGVVFDRPVTITLGLPVRLAPGVEVPLAFYNEETEKWEKARSDDGERIFGVIGSNGWTASAQVSHFTVYGVLLTFEVVKPATFTAEAAIQTLTAPVMQHPIDLGGTVMFSTGLTTGTQISADAFKTLALAFLSIEFRFPVRLPSGTSSGLIQSTISFTDELIRSVMITVQTEQFDNVKVELARRNTAGQIVESLAKDEGAKVTKKRLADVRVTRVVDVGHASGHASGHSSGGIHDSGIGF